MSRSNDNLQFSTVGMFHTVAYKSVHHFRTTFLLSINVESMGWVNINGVINYSVLILRSDQYVYFIVVYIPCIDLEESKENCQSTMRW